MSESIRSFLAFDIENESVRNRLSKTQALLVQTGADVKLVETENIHVTMRFLGDINIGMIDNIFAIMKKLQFAPFEVHIKGIGVFPDLRFPRVIWAGITDGADQLQNVFNQLEPQLQAVGFAPDNKGFSAHLTIARVRSGRNKVQLTEFVTKNKGYEFGNIKAECIRLKKSVLSPDGPTYSTLKEYCPGK